MTVEDVFTQNHRLWVPREKGGEGTPASLGAEAAIDDFTSKGNQGTAVLTNFNYLTLTIRLCADVSGPKTTSRSAAAITTEANHARSQCLENPFKGIGRKRSMPLRQWEEIQEVLPCYGAAWIDRPGGDFPTPWPLDCGRPEGFIEFSKAMARALNAERGATLLSQARNSSIESSCHRQAAKNVISPLCTAATTAALRRLVHLVTGRGGSIICSNWGRHSRAALFACHAGRSAAQSERWVGCTRAVRHDVIPLVWKNSGNRDLIFS